jgi:hypothetical protein
MKLKSVFILLLVLPLLCCGGSLPLQEELEFYDQPPAAVSSSQAWVFGSSASSASPDANQTVTTINTVGKTLLVAYTGTAGHCPTPTNTSNTVWTKCIEQTDGSSGWVTIWTTPVSGGNASESVGIVGSFIYPTLILETYSGGNGGILDQFVATTGSGSTATVQPGTMTPAANNELVVSAMISHVRSTSLTVNSGFSTPVTNMSTTAVFTGAAHSIQTTATAVNPTWTKDSVDFLAAAQASIK